MIIFSEEHKNQGLRTFNDTGPMHIKTIKCILNVHCYICNNNVYIFLMMLIEA
jgi:hypothetical protein